MKTWFTSDPHWGHDNIIKYCDRPYALWQGNLVRPSTIPEGEPYKLDIDAMHRDFIKRWNDRVAPGDTVFLLGDVAMGPRAAIAPMRRKFNGRIVLIRGNHDRSTTAMLSCGFDEVHDSLVYMAGNIDILLVHKPILDDSWKHLTLRTRYQFCGHKHNEWRRIGDVINVGVDQWDYTPISLEEALSA